MRRSPAASTRSRRHRSIGEDERGASVARSRRGDVAESSGDREAKALALAGAGQLLDEQRIAAGPCRDAAARSADSPGRTRRARAAAVSAASGSRSSRPRRRRVRASTLARASSASDRVASDERHAPDQPLDDGDGARVRPLEVVDEQDVRPDDPFDRRGRPVRVAGQVQVRRPGEGQVRHPGQRREAAAFEAPAFRPRPSAARTSAVLPTPGSPVTTTIASAARAARGPRSSSASRPIRSVRSIPTSLTSAYRASPSPRGEAVGRARTEAGSGAIMARWNATPPRSIRSPCTPAPSPTN